MNFRFRAIATIICLIALILSAVFMFENQTLWGFILLVIGIVLFLIGRRKE